jgi:hypothetical protein
MAIKQIPNPHRFDTRLTRRSAEPTRFFSLRPQIAPAYFRIRNSPPLYRSTATYERKTVLRGYHFDCASGTSLGAIAVTVHDTGRTVLMQFASRPSSHRFDTRLTRRVAESPKTTSIKLSLHRCNLLNQAAVFAGCECGSVVGVFFGLYSGSPEPGGPSIKML